MNIPSFIMEIININDHNHNHHHRHHSQAEVSMSPIDQSSIIIICISFMETRTYISWFADALICFRR